MNETNETEEIAERPFASDDELVDLEVPPHPTLATSRELLGRQPDESLEDAVRRLEGLK